MFTKKNAPIFCMCFLRINSNVHQSSILDLGKRRVILVFWTIAMPCPHFKCKLILWVLTHGILNKQTIHPIYWKVHLHFLGYQVELFLGIVKERGCDFSKQWRS